MGKKIIFRQIDEDIMEYIQRHKGEKPKFLIVSPDVVDFIERHCKSLYVDWDTLYYNQLIITVIKTKLKNQMEVR